MATSLEQLLAESACRDLVLASVEAVDQQNYAAFADLFCADGVLIRPDKRRLEGHVAILSAYASRNPDRLTRHLVCNHQVIADPVAGRASSTCSILLWSGKHSDAPTPSGRPADDLQQIGAFMDEFICTPAGWRIAQREAVFSLFQANKGELGR